MLLLSEGGDGTVSIPGKYGCSSHGFWWQGRNPGCGKYALGLRIVGAVLQTCIGSEDQSTAGKPASGNLLDHD